MRIDRRTACDSPAVIVHAPAYVVAIIDIYELVYAEIDHRIPSELAILTLRCTDFAGHLTHTHTYTVPDDKWTQTTIPQSGLP